MQFGLPVKSLGVVGAPGFDGSGSVENGSDMGAEGAIHVPELLVENEAGAVYGPPETPRLLPL